MSQLHQKHTSNKSIIHWIYDQTGVNRRDIRDITRGIISFVIHELRGGRKVNFYGLGTFQPGRRKGRTVIYGDNAPMKQMAGRTFVQKPSITVKFKASAKLRKQINTPATESKP